MSEARAVKRLFEEEYVNGMTPTDQRIGDMVRKQLNVDARWKVIGYEQSIGVYNVTANDGMGKEFVLRGFDMEELKRKMTDAINEYDSAKANEISS